MKTSIEFIKIMRDFYKDILITFPECKEKCDFALLDHLNNNNCCEAVDELYDYCCSVYPERFFDILYQSNDIFTDLSKNAVFLPNIDFKYLWQQDIGDKTRDIIWKYLQMILFSIVNDQKDGKSFGDAAKLFEAIDEDEFKKKIEETLGEMSNIFDMSNVDVSNVDMSNVDMSNINLDDLPDAEKLHDHISGLLNGKIGRLAHEIAEETAKELEVDLEDETSMGDVFNKLFKNPGKLMGMMKKVGSKIDEKLKSGDLKESELMQEATELMAKMKGMPGMDNMKKMFGEMGLPLGKNSKINMNAFQSHMNRNMRKATTKERMKAKLAKRQEEKAEKALKTPRIRKDELTEPEVIPKKKKKRKKKKRKKKKNVLEEKKQED